MKQSTSAAAATFSYFLYRTASRILLPFLSHHHYPTSNRNQRLGYPSSPRPPDIKPLVWFHAVSLGEAVSALPLINHCCGMNCYSVLVTTSTVSSLYVLFPFLLFFFVFLEFMSRRSGDGNVDEYIYNEVIKGRLPNDVIFQIAPIDTPEAVERFLTYWNPFVIFLIESELWPNLILYAAHKGIKLALLNARISSKSFERWSMSFALPLITLMLSKFSLISPLSNIEAVRYQLLGAPPCIIHFAGDLKYGVGEYLVKEKEAKMILNDINIEIGNRPTWLAASIHLGEEQVMIRVHNELIKINPKLLLILVTRHPKDGRNIALALKEQKVNIALRSKKEPIGPNTSIYIIDTLGELRVLYKASKIAVIGGSFLPHLCGHKFSEAAAASAAVLTGPHIGHFHHMLTEMRQIDPFSVKQVGGEDELVEYLKLLLSDNDILEAHKKASKHSFDVMSKGVVDSVWSLVEKFVID